MALQKTTPHKIILVDAGPKESAAIGAGLGIAPNGANALSFIDADDILTKRGCMSHGVQMGRGDAGRLLIKELTSETYSKNWGYGNHGISRQVLVGGLRELAEKRNVDMRFNMRLTAVEEKDQVVTARFKDGTTLDADLLIGCDGIHSVVRSYVVGDVAKPRYAGVSTVQGLSNLSAEDEAAAGLNHSLNFWLGHGVMFGTYPADQEGSWSWFCAFISEDPKGGESDWAKDNSLAVLTKLASEKTAGWESPVPSTVIPRSYRAYPVGLYDRDPMNVWHKGRVVLCGDSAHPTTPFGGQGSQMAAESAILLARLLGANEPSDELFQKYVQLRRPRTDAVTINARNGMGAVFGITSWRLSFILEYLRDGFLYMLGPSFFRSGMRGLFAYNVTTTSLD
ncbi:hypothetical protein M408DRAFT_327579 [Serendipita vermifera MAFF 305830]|uniref:FAD-binding domain-containing protein n=1 Tax=Serendipita vermifera MAFF 305830 TaxID=933852 RepID=A0A0C3B3D0_SERVB|nr:hypothetical protein M408DRAFT_327579 [Serendipita vermifera MAFF 305830]